MKISKATERITNIYGKRRKVGKCTQNVKITNDVQYIYVPGSVPSLRAERDLDPDQPVGHHAHHLPPQVTILGVF